MAKDIKTGGRQKGTPNRSTAFFRQHLENVLSKYIEDGVMYKDLMAINDSKDRMAAASRLPVKVFP
ncbi:MAG: hypothetical protein IJ154_05515 [Bacteroidales bacterium]|nr:hypothetical protein [Bacteroidales bacterium]